MALVTPQRKRQRNLILVMGGVVVVTLAVLYLGLFRGEGGGGGVGDGGGLDVSLPIPKGFVLDTSILMEERFRGLVPYGKISTDIKTGRDNPFVPY